MVIQEKHTLYRLYLIAAVLMLLGGGITYRLFFLQFVEGDKYRALAEERTIQNFTIAPARGNIYADDGSLLATSVSRYTIRFDAVTVKQHHFQSNIKPLSKALSEVLDKPANHYESLLLNARRSSNRYQLIARNIPYSQYSKIIKMPLFKMGGTRGGLIVERNLLREHPIDKMAERTIGYERKDKDGYYTRVGLEGGYGSILRGKDGQRLMQKVANGEWRPISDANQKEPQNGYDLISTINVNIQDVAHNALLEQLEKFEADHGSVVVMETQTGAIKAISNLGRTKSGKYFEKLNYAVGESHEPGSTFKLMAMMVALEDKVIDTMDIVNTGKGELTFFNKYKVRDSKRGGYGKISVNEVFQVSSNTGIVKIISEHYQSNPEKFVNRLYNIGMNEPLGLKITGEGLPKIPHPSDSDWNGLTLPWMAYGYGVSLTPMQTLTFYNAIANNGEMVKPRFVDAVRQLGNQPIQQFEKEIANPSICSEETLGKLQKMMKMVVESDQGTAHNIYSDNISIAGKTGTCQRDYNTDDLQYISSFVGYFPADKPQYSCIVVIHKPNKKKGYYGSTVAAPVFKKIADKMYRSIPKEEKIEVPPLNLLADTSFQSKMELTSFPQQQIPNVVGLPAMDAVSLLENRGVQVTIKGKGHVRKQSLAPGRTIKKNTSITLELS